MKTRKTTKKTAYKPAAPVLLDLLLFLCCIAMMLGILYIAAPLIVGALVAFVVFFIIRKVWVYVAAYRVVRVEPTSL